MQEIRVELTKKPHAIHQIKTQSDPEAQSSESMQASFWFHQGRGCQRVNLLLWSAVPEILRVRIAILR